MQALVEADAGKRAGVSLKSLTLADHIEAKKATYAVTCQAMKYYPVLTLLAQRAQVAYDKVSEYTALILIYELLFGEGIHQRGPAERALLKHKDALQAALPALMKERGVKRKEELLPQQAEFPGRPHPRWVRVNTLKASVAQTLAQLKADHPAATTDPLLPELLALPPGTDLHAHPLVTSGACILQGKSSCMPAAALAPEPGWQCVDCCAAPGNKTTHLAARMQGHGTVWAFDKDGKRLSRLQAAVQRAGAAQVVQCCQADFLSVDTLDPQYAQVRGVLLDPSCSGSGTVYSRMDHLLPSRQASSSRGKQQQQQQQQQDAEGAEGPQDHGSEDVSERVQQLARFQLTALRHALTFPALQRLVYSTCSIHAEENERVVQQAMDTARQLGFELVDPFPSWPRRGLPLFPGCEKLVRTDAHEDGTDGFFVAVFQKQAAAGEAASSKSGKSGKRTAPQPLADSVAVTLHGTASTLAGPPSGSESKSKIGAVKQHRKMAQHKG